MHRLIIATHSGLYFVRLDADSGLLEDSRLIDAGYHYGLATSSDPTSGATRIYAYRGGASLDRQDHREVRIWKVRNDSFELQSRVSLPLETADVHQISRDSDGSLLLANTALNCIDRWDPEQGLIGRHLISSTRVDVNHVNSLFPVGNHLGVMLHNRRKRESQIAILRTTGDAAEELGRFSLPDVQCHNIGVLGTRLYYNASSARSLVCIDLSDLKERGRRSCSEHTKGLCCDGRRIFVGLSDYAGRQARAHSCGWLMIVRPEDLRVQARIQITEPSRGQAIGNINEIRLLGSADVFETGSEANRQAFVSSLSIPQSRAAIALRRAWIRANDVAKRTARWILELR